MRINHCKASDAPAMDARQSVATIGIVEHCGAVAVILADNRHVTRAPQHGHAGGRCGGRELVPIRHDPEITHGMPERLNARSTAAEQLGRAASRVLNDLAATVNIERRLRFLARRHASDNRSTLLAVHLPNAGVRRSMLPIRNRGHAPLLAPTRADGGRRGIGRPGGTKQTKNQQDETAYPQTAGPHVPSPFVDTPSRSQAGNFGERSDRRRINASSRFRTSTALMAIVGSCRVFFVPALSTIGTRARAYP